MLILAKVDVLAWICLNPVAILEAFLKFTLVHLAVDPFIFADAMKIAILH